MRRVAALLLLGGCLPVTVAAQQPASGITVIASPSFRPTGVLLPHLQFYVAVDTAAGGLVLANLTVNPVTFTGTIRVEGARAGAREPEPGGFADSVRFGGDGQVALLVADAGSHAPIVVEPHGARNAAGGRLSITAPNWPFSRVLVITIDPADLFEHYWRAAGYGVRDRIRVDDRRGMAFLTDTTVGGTVVAIGMGSGTRGVLRADITTVLVTQRLGEELGRDRRTVGKLVLVIDPARDPAGTAHAEIMFGVGASEDEAAQAAQAASAERDAAPAGAMPRLATPSRDVDLVFGQLLAATRPMLDWDRLAGARSLPAGSGDALVARPADGWRGAALALQLGDADAVCGHYRLFRRYGTAGGTPPHGVALRLGARGRSLAIDSASAGTVDEEAGQILTGYACYRATRDSAWLAGELPVLRGIAQRHVDVFSQDWSAVRGDVRAGLLLLEALQRLVEMEDEAAARWGFPAAPDRGAMGGAVEQLRAALASSRAAPRWDALSDAATSALRSGYGRPADQPDTNGLTMAAAGAFFDRVIGGLFGVTEHLDGVDVAPRMDGVADDFTWRLEGWRLAGDSLALSYRPADRSATIRLGALRQQRLTLRFPWLTPQSCVAVRRGTAPDEHPALVLVADGGVLVDLRAFFDPAEVTVSAAPCAQGR